MVGDKTSGEDQLEINRQIMEVPENVNVLNFPNHADERTKRQIENNFKYHAPKEGQPEIYTALRAKAKEFAELINQVCPASREKSLAITELETSVFWANASIAREESA